MILSYLRKGLKRCIVDFTNQHLKYTISCCNIKLIVIVLLFGFCPKLYFTFYNFNIYNVAPPRFKEKEQEELTRPPRHGFGLSFSFF